MIVINGQAAALVGCGSPVAEQWVKCASPAECVRQSGRSLSVLDYTCAECRRGGITSRAAAVRLAPRTIATLFMAKRRFNKYAHRQYMEQRLREAEPPLLLLAPQPSDDERDDPDAASDPLDADGPPEHTSSCS